MASATGARQLLTRGGTKVIVVDRDLALAERTVTNDGQWLHRGRPCRRFDQREARDGRIAPSHRYYQLLWSIGRLRLSFS